MHRFTEGERQRRFVAPSHTTWSSLEKRLMIWERWRILCHFCLILRCWKLADLPYQDFIYLCALVNHLKKKLSANKSSQIPKLGSLCWQKAMRLDKMFLLLGDVLGSHIKSLMDEQNKREWAPTFCALYLANVSLQDPQAQTACRRQGLAPWIPTFLPDTDTPQPTQWAATAVSTAGQDMLTGNARQAMGHHFQPHSWALKYDSYCCSQDLPRNRFKTGTLYCKFIRLSYNTYPKSQM